jgi:formate dehydrogenase gamma subunit
MLRGRAMRRPEGKAKEGEGKKGNGVRSRYFTRFTLNQRIQHVLLLVMFTVLVVTGLPLKYADSEISQTIVNWMGGWEMRSQIHHFAGFALIGLGIYHIIWYIVAGKRSKKMLARKRDFTDFFQHVKYLVGKAKQPKYDRYSWKEKFEYWAIVWGLLIMAITGIIMMYPARSAEIFGSFGWVEVAWTAHSYEALLAVLAIVIWHMWSVHLHPKKFPMNNVWITGKLTEDEMKDEHPLEYDEIIRKEDDSVKKPDKPKPQEEPDRKGVVTEKM